MLSALVAWTAVLLVPQEGGVQVPPDSEHLEFSPYSDAQGQPRAARTAAAGAADFDGDGNADLWFLAEELEGQLSVQLADTAHAGRYRPWHSHPPAGFTHAATFRSDYYQQDRLLLAAPGEAGLRTLLFQPGPPSGDPRDGFWFDMPNFWLGDTGIYEVETRNDAGDRHDDVVVLVRDALGGTTVKKLVIEGSYSPQVTSIVETSLPLPMEHLELFDHDGDGRTDFAAVVPGVALVIYRDDGQGGFSLTGAVSAPGRINDLAAGDLLGDGHDDLAVCIDDWILVGLFSANDVRLHVLERLAGTAAIADLELLDDGDRPRIAATAADGRDLAIYELDPDLGVFDPGTRITLVDPPASSRVRGSVNTAQPSTLGNPIVALPDVAFAVDVDGDGDRDLVARRPDGAAWLTLRNEVRSLRLAAPTLTDLGPVGETGYVKQEFSFPLPADWDPLEITTVEAAVLMVQLDEPTYWGRLMPQVDPVARTVSFHVYTQTDPTKLPNMQNPYQFADGITAGGEAAITVHGVVGNQRLESLHMHHEPGGDGNGSGSGAKWTMTSTPPLPSSPNALLPFSAAGGG